MFWIGMLVGIVAATIAVAGWLVYCCWKVYGSWATFTGTCDVIQAASENRESVVVAYHEGEVLTHATFEEL